MNINKVMLYGNLTRDPEFRQTPSGQSVCALSIATNREFKGRDGQKQSQAEYHSIVVWGRQAETVNQYMRRGSAIFVEGRLQTRTWDGKDGKKKYKTEVVAEKIQFGPRSASGSAKKGRSYEEDDDIPPQEHPEEDSIDLDDEIKSEDIPF
jgi:single-strand DNA-binding protein